MNDLDDKCEIVIIHLINSGSAAIDGNALQKIDGKPAIKPYWDITGQELLRSLEKTLKD